MLMAVVVKNTVVGGWLSHGQQIQTATANLVSVVVPDGINFMLHDAGKGAHALQPTHS